MSAVAQARPTASQADDAGVAVTLTRISKAFGHRGVLQGIDFFVPAGAISRHRGAQRIGQEHVVTVTLRAWTKQRRAIFCSTVFRCGRAQRGSCFRNRASFHGCVCAR